MFSATKSFFTNEATGGGAPTPSWTIDFSTGSTYSDLVFARAANTATYVDSSGYIAGRNADQLRLTHDKNGSRLGLLVEGQRQNVHTRSEDISLALSLVNGSIDTNGGSFWTSPDNGLNARKYLQNTSTGNHGVQTTHSSRTQNCFSVFLQKTTSSGQGRFATLSMRVDNSNYVHATFDLDAGTMTQAGTVGSTLDTRSEGIEDYGNGWYRCYIAATRTSSGNVQIGVFMATSGTPTMNPTSSGVGQSYTGSNSTDGLYVWGIQLEAVTGPPTSYIKTTGSAVTRNNDTAYILDSSITGWADPGAIVVSFYPVGQAGTILSTDDASAEQLGIEASSTTDVRAFWSNGSTSTGTMTTGVQKAVHYWSGTASSFCLNGGTVQTGTNNIGTFGNIDFVTLGAEATDSSGTPGTYSQFSNLIIRKIDFYAGTLSSGDLQTITT
jgi:hypothetical protein